MILSGRALQSQTDCITTLQMARVRDCRLVARRARHSRSSAVPLFGVNLTRADLSRYEQDKRSSLWTTLSNLEQFGHHSLQRLYGSFFAPASLPVYLLVSVCQRMCVCVCACVCVCVYTGP